MKDLKAVERKLKEVRKLYRELRKEKDDLTHLSKDREPRLNLSRQMVLLNSTTERLLRLKRQIKKGLEKNGS